MSTKKKPSRIGKSKGSSSEISGLRTELKVFKDEFREQFNHLEKRVSDLAEDTGKQFVNLEEKLGQRISDLAEDTGKQFVNLEEKLGQRISDGVESVRALVESIRHDNRAVSEGHQHLSTRLDGHEERIDRLEKRP